MQKILSALLLFSVSALQSNAQEYLAGYSEERLDLVRNLFMSECAGTQAYCDCILEGVATTIPFNKLRETESAQMINYIIRDCQERYNQFPLDNENPPKLVLDYSLEFNQRANSTVYQRDTLVFNYSVQNNGSGIGYAPALIINVNGLDGSLFDYQRRIPLKDMKPQDKIIGSLQIIPESLVANDSLTISCEVIEGNKWPSNKEILKLWSIASSKSNKQIVFIPENEFDGIRYTVRFQFKNIGKAPLRKPHINFTLESGSRVTPAQWITTSKNALYDFDFDATKFPGSGSSVANVIYPGEVIFGDFQFVLEPDYRENTINLSATFTDDLGWRDMKEIEIPVQSTAVSQTINLNRLSSSQNQYIVLDEVDEVEKTTQPRGNHFAVIIGNENYSSTGVTKVDYAKRDAETFKRYCVNVLGVPEENVEFVLNGSAAQMKSAVERTIKRSVHRESPVVYYYYAGHGWPKEDTQEPLLIPADIGPNQLDMAVKLNNTMASFRKDEDLELFAFVDACYASNKFSEETRQFIIEVQEPLVQGNQILFSAVSSNQEANKHDESSHGVFTYYLLKALKNNPRITIDELYKELTKQVSDYTVIKGKKEQTPSLHIAPEIKEESTKWRLRK